MNRYSSYVSFGFNCEVGFALESLELLQQTLFTWADIRGTKALLYGIRNPSSLLAGRVTQYSSNMFFCENSKIGFHGRLKFSDAVDSEGRTDFDAIANSLNETRSRIAHLEIKQREIFAVGKVLVVVKYFADIFSESFLPIDCVNHVRSALSEEYDSSNFDILCVVEGPSNFQCDIGSRDYVRTIRKFSPRERASAIDANEWRELMTEFITPSLSKLSRELQTASKYWSEKKTQYKTRWWQVPSIVNHVNYLICGEPVTGASGGIHRRLQKLSNGKPFNKGISVACGNGAKEMKLVQLGICNWFDLYEISDARVEQGIALARSLGVHDRVRFHVLDVFNEIVDSDYDLVYWDSALHHMLDVDFAIRWSRDALVNGGVFFMHDYVGASRFQWSDFQCNIATQVRGLLSDRFLVNPNSSSHSISREFRSPNLEKLIKVDPTEAADSVNIIPSLLKHFPEARVTLTGGAVYHTALNDVMANFDDHLDRDLMSVLLLLDKTLIELGEYNFAVADAIKI